MDVSDRYKGSQGEEYFAYQNKSRRFGGELNAEKFRPFIRPGDKVLDYGCGGGWLLMNLNCAAKVGVDPNPAARAQCCQNKIEVYTDLSEVDGCFDRIITHHCLEHVPSPIESLKALRDKLTESGLIIVVVPIDDWRNQLTIDENIDNHLHTWTPKLLANILREAGYRPLHIDVLTHAWPPFWDVLYRKLPTRVFHVLCRVHSVVVKRRQLLAVASKAS